MSEQATKGSPWDVFIHLLAVIALYVSIYGALILLFQFVNLALPDPLDNQIDVHDYIRYGVSMVVIFFPAYAWAWRSIEIDLGANPEKRWLWVRTCPIYLTLFLAGLLALSDLSFLVYFFLTGDLTSRFLLKVAAILAIAGAVEVFYLDALRREPGRMPLATRTFAYAVSALAAAIVIAGFAVAGSPGRARLARLDVKRLEDLAGIQRKIVEYWQSKAVLPASLDQLADNVSGYSAPSDPVNGKPYGYRVAGVTVFELCADFDTNDPDAARSLPRWSSTEGGVDTTWNHPSGHACFPRTIDSSRYPPKGSQSSPDP